MIYIENIVTCLLGYLPNLGQAILVLIVGYFLAVFMSRLIGRILEIQGLNAEIWALMPDIKPDDPKAKTIDVAFDVLFFCALISFFGALGMGWVASLLVGFGVITVLILVIAAFSGKMKNFLKE